MAKWWPFGRKKEQPPQKAPRREPTPRPAPEQPPAPPKRRGLLGRIKDRVRPKPKEAPPAAPPLEEAPPAPPEAPPAPVEEAAPPEGAPPAAPPEESRVYPPYLHVSATGEWKISDTVWYGTMSGTLHGRDVKTFLDAMEQDPPDYETAIPLIADAYGIPGGLIDVAGSRVDSVDY